MVKNFLKKLFKILFRLAFILIILSGLFILLAEFTISRNAKNNIFDDYQDLPDNQVVLVLGTSKRLANGNPNLFFSYRMQAASELYENDKACAFVVSGDNRHMSYNEPRDMKKTLIELGVPDSIIYLDYAGFRTLDSVVRMKKVFGQSSFTIVSQKFHNQRAVYIAKKNGIEAYGYNARDVNMQTGFKTFVRERFARVKVFVDILTKKQPRFLGEPINIE